MSSLQSVQERCDDAEFELSNIRVSLERYKGLVEMYKVNEAHSSKQAGNTQTASATPDLQVATNAVSVPHKSFIFGVIA